MENEVVKFVRKANDLVEARYKFDIWETRLFTKMLTLVQKDDEEFKEYKVYLRDIIVEFDLVRNKEAYELLRTGARKLMKKEFYDPVRDRRRPKKALRSTRRGLARLGDHRRNSRLGPRFVHPNFVSSEAQTLPFAAQNAVHDVRCAQYFAPAKQLFHPFV